MKVEKAFRQFMALIAISLVIFSCNPGREKTITKSTGKTAEILIVIDEVYWNSISGEVLRKIFLQEMEGMPQSEASYNLLRIDSKFLDDAYRKHHNIFIVEIDKKYKEAKVETKDNYWAAPQRLIRVTAPTEEIFVEAVEGRKASLLDLVRKAERERLMRLFTRLQDWKLSNKIKDNFGIKMTIPSGFYVAANQPDFMWIRKETKDFSQALLIYTTPYTDTSLFDLKIIINRRNQLCRIHIPGPSEGSYMKTAVSIIPVSRTMIFKDKFAVETRGLWDVEGDFMGGPFLNYAIHDEKSNRILNIEGYVFYPNKDKRDLMMQMETIIYSVEF